MPRNHCVHQERGLFGRQTHVAPLPADRCDQVGVVGQPAQNIIGIAVDGGRRLPFPVRGRKFTLPGFQQPLQTEHRGGAGSLGPQLHVAIYGLLFGRKLCYQIVAEFPLARAGAKHLVANVETVVLLVHRRPFELAAGEEIEQAAAAGAAPHVTDVVHTHIPLIAGTRIGVRIATSRIVLLQHADLLAKLAEQGRRGQAADAGADYHGVVARRQAIGAVTPSDTQCAGFQCSHIPMLPERADGKAP